MLQVAVGTVAVCNERIVVVCEVAPQQPILERQTSDGLAWLAARIWEWPRRVPRTLAGGGCARSSIIRSPRFALWPSPTDKLANSNGNRQTVAIGTNDAQLAIQTDLQVASRFEPCHLPRWSATEEFRGFLAAFVRGLPLHEPSDITDRKSVQLLLSRSGGITGRITLILARAAELAIRRRREAIDAEWLELASRDLDLAPCLPA